MTLDDLASAMRRNRAAYDVWADLTDAVPRVARLHQLLDSYWWDDPARIGGMGGFGLRRPGLRAEVEAAWPAYARLRGRLVPDGRRLSSLQPPPGGAGTWLAHWVRAGDDEALPLAMADVHADRRTFEAALAEQPDPPLTDSGLNGATVATAADLVALLGVARLAWGRMAAGEAGPRWDRRHPLTACELASVLRAADRLGTAHDPPPADPTLEDAAALAARLAAALTAAPEPPADPRSPRAGPPTRTGQRRTVNEWMTLVAAFAADHPAATVADLARHAGVDVKHIYRLFRRLAAVKAAWERGLHAGVVERQSAARLAGNRSTPSRA